MANNETSFVAMFLVALLSFGLAAADADPAASFLDNTAFVIVDQRLNTDIRDATFKDLYQALTSHGVSSPHILTVQENLPVHGAWTIFPLFRSLSQLPGATDWFVLLNENARVSPTQLENLLAKFDPQKEVFIGKGLTDPDRVIIHHFQKDLDFQYPDFGSAVIMSKALVDDMAEYLEFHDFKVRGLPNDFSIDAQFELSQAIHLRHADDSEGDQVRLTHSSQLCTKKTSDDCAVWREPHQCQSASSPGITTLAKQTLFAVKTCKKYHDQRLPVIKETWAKSALNVQFISEEEDDAFGTLVLPEVKHNTERGHCMKTEAIFKHFNKTSDDMKWLVIADDDTILSVAKLLQMLRCYEPDSLVAIGQRYGFRVAKGRFGYDYPTGGAGMIFSRALVKKMMQREEVCQCTAPDTPDDMHIGSCLAALGVSMVHSDRMHQGRAEDYSPELINHQDPVSFHKFWDCDPIKTYQDWFSLADQDLAQLKKQSLHDEL